MKLISQDIQKLELSAQIDKKLSYRWQTARRRIGQILPLLPTFFLFDAFNGGILLSYRVYI